LEEKISTQGEVPTLTSILQHFDTDENPKQNKKNSKNKDKSDKTDSFKTIKNTRKRKSDDGDEENNKENSNAFDKLKPPAKHLKISRFNEASNSTEESIQCSDQVQLGDLTTDKSVCIPVKKSQMPLKESQKPNTTSTTSININSKDISTTSINSDSKDITTNLPVKPIDLNQSNLAKKLEKKKLYTAQATDSSNNITSSGSAAVVNPLAASIGTSLKFPKLKLN